MYFKGCPKCHGDLFSGEDMHGGYVSCAQCGYLRDLPDENDHPLAGKTYVDDSPKAPQKGQKESRQAVEPRVQG